MDDASDQDRVAEKEIVDSWIGWFCTLEGHEYMVEVDADYIKDPFNLFGFDQLSKDKFKKCIEIILTERVPTEDELADE